MQTNLFEWKMLEAFLGNVISTFAWSFWQQYKFILLYKIILSHVLILDLSFY